MKLTKILALILAAILCTSMFTACLGGNDNEEDDRDDEDVEEKEEEEEAPSGEDKEDDTEENDKKPSDPSENEDEDESPVQEELVPGDYISADYNGEDFTFLHIQRTSGNRDYYGGPYLDADGITGLQVNDAVYMRNLAVEEKYNVKIVERIEGSGYSEPSEILGSFYMSGDYCFDVVYGWGYKLGSCIVEGYFADASALPSVDMTKEYWASSNLDELSINGKTYIFTSDISMNRIDWANMLFFNKDLVTEYGLEDSVGNFYDLVNNGQWTIDKYLEAITSVSNDIGTDGTIDAMTDTYGLITGTSSGYAEALACGVELVTKNDDGTYALAYYNGDNVDLANKIREVFSDSRYVKDYMDVEAETTDIPEGMDIWQYFRSPFANGNTLFLTGAPNLAFELAGTTFDYGILPMPKRDENQSSHLSIIDANAALFAIPSTYRQDMSTAGPDRTGAILEYMSAASNEIVVPAYYNTLFKGGMGEKEDIDMLKIIKNNTKYVLVNMVSTYGDNLSLISTCCEDMFYNPNTATTMYRTKSTVMQKALNDFYADIMKLDQ